MKGRPMSDSGKDAGALARAREHLSHQAALRDELSASRDVLIQERARIDVLIREHEDAIAELSPKGEPTVHHAVRLHTPDHEHGTRTSGVKAIAEKVMREMHATRTWTPQDMAVEEICKRDSRIKPKSAAAALSRLVDESVLLREGKRGSYRFALKSEKPIGSDAGDEPHADLSPTELVLGKLKTSGPEGCTKKDISWLVGDVSDLDTLLNKLIADGEIHVSGDGLTARYSLAERVSHPRSLFDDVEHPSS